MKNQWRKWIKERRKREQREKNEAARSYCRANREGATAFNGGDWRGVIAMRGREKESIWCLIFPLRERMVQRMTATKLYQFLPSPFKFFQFIFMFSLLSFKIWIRDFSNPL